jgi:uncharacterized membrane protein (DUF485 family)
MVLHDHAHDDEAHDEAAAARNARLGRWLFVGYLALYVGYMWMVSFRPDLMRKTLGGGLNTAVWYGFGLIIAAIVLSFVYGWLCRKKENAS